MYFINDIKLIHIQDLNSADFVSFGCHFGKLKQNFRVLHKKKKQKLLTVYKSVSSIHQPQQGVISDGSQS